MCAYRPISNDLMEIPVDSPVDAIMAAEHLAGHRQPAGGVAIIATTGSEIVNAFWGDSVEGLEHFAIAPEEHGDRATDVTIILFDTPPHFLPPSQALAAVLEARRVRVSILTVSGGHYRRVHPADGPRGPVPYKPGDSGFDRKARAVGSTPFASIDALIADWLDPVDDAERERHLRAEASEYLLRVIADGTGGEAVSIVVMAALVDAAATTRRRGIGLGTEQTVPVLCLLNDHRMQRLLRACCQIADHETAIGVTCDLARYASSDQRGPALAFVAYALLAGHRRTIAHRVLAIAREAAPEHEVVQYVADAIDGPRPVCDPTALAKATASLLQPPVIVYRLADVHALVDAARRAGDAAGRVPQFAVIAAEGFRLTCDLTAGDGASVAPLEAPDPEEWGPGLVTLDFAINDSLIEGLRRGADQGAPHVIIRPFGLDRGEITIARPPASRN